MRRSCMICGAASTGTHFGVQSCNACSIFFRRTIKSKRKYRCENSIKCRIEVAPYMKCRACRLKKCFELGMNWKVLLNSDQDVGDIPHHANVNGTLVNTFTLEKQSTSIFNELRESYVRLKYRREIFYKNCSNSTVNDNEDKFFVEIKSFFDSLFRQHAVEPKLYLSLVAEYSVLEELQNVEKRHVFFTAAKRVQALEVLYSSWKCRKYQDASCFAMPNGIFANIRHLEMYLKNDMDTLQASNVDTIYKIYVLTIINAIEIINGYFTAVQPTHDELVFLIGLLVLDPSIPNISKTTINTLQLSRNLLIKGFMTRSENEMIDGVLRFDSICSIIAATKIYVQKLRENIIMLRYFNVITHDALFDELWNVE